MLLFYFLPKCPVFVAIFTQRAPFHNKIKLWHTLCIFLIEQKFLGITRSCKLQEPLNFRIMNMKRTNDTIEMLQYQLKRYKAMRKGATCQSLQFKLQKLTNQSANN